MVKITTPESYDIVKLHDRSADCWAVVGARSGAILTEGDRLMMRLARDEAAAVARRATSLAKASDGAGTEAAPAR